MKRFGLIIVGLVFVSFVSAIPLTGFWGLPWGASMSEIETIMAQKGYKAAAKATGGWIYRNVTFAGRNGDVFFVLRDSKLAGGSFRFFPKKNLVYDTFNSLKQDLIDKYGTPTREQEEYTSPYSKGDGFTEIAITLNKLKLSTAWEFEDKSLILLSMDSDQSNYSVTVSLNYYTGFVREETKKSVMDDL